jgi:hypothetical protein
MSTVERKMKNKMKVESEKIGTQMCRYDISPASHLAPDHFPYLFFFVNNISP